MANCNNQTQQCDFLNLQQHLYVLFGLSNILLVISVSCNIFFFVSKCCSGEGKCRNKRQSPRHMEDNPIYGNISFTQTNVTEVDRPHSSLSSSSLRDQHRVNPKSQSNNQDCYANLTLKPPRPQSGRSSPQIQYSDVVLVEVPLEPEKEGEGNTDAISTMSDLYASVQTQRIKVNTADNGEDYANHF